MRGRTASARCCEGLTRFGWKPVVENGNVDRAHQRCPMLDHARARRPVRAVGRAARDHASDLRRGARASATRCKRGLRRARHRHARARLRPEMAARGHPVDAQGPLQDHARLHAEEGHARPRHDAAHLHRAGQPRLRRPKPTWCASSASASRCSRSRPRCSPTRRSPRASPTGFSAIAAMIWTDTDPDRCGMLPFVFEAGFGFERYVDYLLDVPMYFVYRDGKYIDCQRPVVPRLPGRASCRRCRAKCPSIGDWVDHLTTAFPEVRLKRFLEMRGADGGPWRRLCALPALWVGLLYDEAALACRRGNRQGLDLGGSPAAPPRGAAARIEDPVQRRQRARVGPPRARDCA